MKVIILGAGGMFGHVLFTESKKKFETIGTVNTSHFTSDGVLVHVNVFHLEQVKKIITEFKPQIVVNAVGVTKQSKMMGEENLPLYLNAQFPHLLLTLAHQYKFKVLHISTDCVFSGKKGSYTEDDQPDPVDLYGKTKLDGEINDPHSLTLRTSIIGHEIRTQNGLVEWFLHQSNHCKGYKKAIFSGFPTIVLTDFLLNKIFPAMLDGMSGLYNFSTDAINKFDLLNLIAHTYGKKITIEPDSSLVVDRSLDSSVFKTKMNFSTPDWETMIKNMHSHFKKCDIYKGKKYDFIR